MILIVVQSSFRKGIDGDWTSHKISRLSIAHSSYKDGRHTI